MVLWFYTIVKTTLDIPDPLYRRAKMRAFAQGTTLKDVLLRGLQREVDGEPAAAPAPLLTRAEQATYTVNDLGFVVLKRPAGARVVTDDQINRLREQEGV